MIAPPTPTDEAERLAELLRYEILDARPEADFDAITAFVAKICRMPIALVSIVDAERQWFASRVGLDVTETPRDNSFCAHAILEPDRLMIVPDVMRDERFRDNPLVTGDPNIRFYAGTPLVTSGGHALGTLCVIDSEPRTMTVDQQDALRMAGRAVEILLEQRRTIKDLHTANQAQTRVENDLRAEIRQRNVVEEHLAYAAAHDGLTKLMNRHAFIRRLKSALHRLHDGFGQPFAVGFIDLDHFKDVNDRLGHLAGDALLIEVGRRFAEMTRASDCIARLSGDEFTIMIEGARTVGEANAVAVRIATTLASRRTLYGQDFDITASVGIVLVDTTYDTVEDIIHDADIAMYAAKERGRNCYAVFTPELRDRFKATADLDRALRNGLERQEFWLAYQPIVALGDPSSRPQSFEALLRWKHGDGSSIGAADFIAAAERTGLIVELGYWVLREACAQAGRWPFGAGARVITAVNVSPKQLAQVGFCSEVKRIVEESGLDPRLLALEITENILITDCDAARAVVVELREFGIKVYLDDFGTGYSSVSYLRDFPFDRIKIDRSFVSGRGDELADPVIVRSIVSLAHELGIEVIAEGVESAAQRDALIELGCDHAQGYFFGRPVEAVEAGESLAPVA